MIFAHSITGVFTTTKPDQTVRLCCHSEYIRSCYIADEDKVIRKLDDDILYTFQDAGDHKVIFEIKDYRKTLAGMFAFCFGLTAVKFNEDSLEYVEDVRGMFAMTALSEMDLSACRKNQIQEMAYMFAGCEKLEKCKIGNLPLKKKDVNDVFRGCNKNIRITRYD